MFKVTCFGKGGKSSAKTYATKDEAIRAINKCGKHSHSAVKQ